LVAGRGWRVRQGLIGDRGISRIRNSHFGAICPDLPRVVPGGRTVAATPPEQLG